MLARPAPRRIFASSPSTTLTSNADGPIPASGIRKSTDQVPKPRQLDKPKQAGYEFIAGLLGDGFARYERPCPRRAASIAAMSIFFIPIIASNARLAAARSGSVIASISARGVICQDKPQRSLHQPH